MKKLLMLSAFAMMLGTSCSNDWFAENGFDDNAADSGNQLDSISGIDACMYAEARIFPGLVDTTKEAHIDTTLVLNLSYPYHSADDLGLYAPFQGSSSTGYSFAERMPQPIYSTGVYAGAGELVTITLPEGNNYGLTVQIGMQTDDLSDVGSYLRQPIAFTRKTLFPGKNQVRFPLGGYVWLIRDHNAVGASDLKVHISGGVYAAPDFVYGKTDVAAWEQKVRNTTVPWMDIRGNRVTFSVNRERIVEMMNSNPKFASELNYCLNFWDKMAEYRYKQLGLRIGDSNPLNCLPSFHDRFIFDVQLKYNKAYHLMHIDNDQGVMLMQTSSFYNQLLSWNTIKKLDVNDIYQTLMSKYKSNYGFVNDEVSSIESYIPLFTTSQYYYQNQITDSLNGLGLNLSQYVPEFLKYINTTEANEIEYDWTKTYTDRTSATNSAYLLLQSQINEYGKKYHGEEDWAFLNETNRNCRLGKKYSADLFTLLCEHYGKNFISLFDRYGFKMSDAQRATAEKYPLLREEVWKINPLKKNPTEGVGTWNGKWHYRIDRRQWDAFATSKANYGDSNESTDANRGPVTNLFDNVLWTYWRNQLKKDDAYIELPYYVIIDMKKAQTLNGVYYADGWENCVSHFKVQVLDDTSDLELGETENANWKDWGEVNQTLDQCLIKERYVEFASPRTTRYLRLVFDKENLYSRPDDTWSESDKKKFESNHKSRYQLLAEFGAWHY